MKHLPKLREIDDRAQKNFRRSNYTGGTTLSSTRRERRALAIVLSSSDKPSHLPHCQHEVPLCRILFASVRRQIFGELLWHRQFQSNQFPHAALFPCPPVQNL